MAPVVEPPADLGAPLEKPPSAQPSVDGDRNGLEPAVLDGATLARPSIRPIATRGRAPVDLRAHLTDRSGS